MYEHAKKYTSQDTSLYRPGDVRAAVVIGEGNSPPAAIHIN